MAEYEHMKYYLNGTFSTERGETNGILNARKNFLRLRAQSSEGGKKGGEEA